MRLENDEGLPWTAAAGLGWIVLLVVVTFGWAYFALSLYLAVWIRSKGRSSLPLTGFLLPTLCFIPNFLHLNTAMIDWISTAMSILWLAATFILRSEIKAYYRKSEGWNIEISPWLTLFLSSIYINYCLNPATLSSHRDTVTSLNLSIDPKSEKIDL